MNFIFKLSFVLFLLNSSIYSNMKVPRKVIQFPSSTIFQVSPLVVNKEILHFECPEIHRAITPPFELECKVKAVYEILSSSVSIYTFEFIALSNKGYTILVNKNKTNYTTKLTDTKSPPFDKYKIESFCIACAREKLSQLYTISFSNQLIKGINLIQVEYLQPLSSIEYGYELSRNSKWKHFFYYELWPLKEWILSETFSLSIQVNSPVEITPTKLQRKKSISCDDGKEDTKFSSYFENSTLEYSDEQVTYKLKFGKNFPDRLRCMYFQ